MFGNQFKTVLLMAILSGIFLTLGFLLGGNEGLTIAFAMALIFNGIMYFFSDRIVLSMYGAKKLDEAEYGSVYATVHELATTMHLPMPKLWLVNSHMANAFATGRNPKNASIAVTTGILSILDADELRGVLAHELSHVKNRDILVSTIAATMAASIGYVCNMLRYGAFNKNNKEQKGNSGLIFITALLMPLAASLIQLAISRSREYLADETGAHSCKDPLSLASALEKLHAHVPHAHLNATDSVHASMASLCIVNPFSGQNIVALFSTHPPVQQRIARLRKISEKLY